MESNCSYCKSKPNHEMEDCKHPDYMKTEAWAKAMHEDGLECPGYERSTLAYFQNKYFHLPDFLWPIRAFIYDRNQWWYENIIKRTKKYHDEKMTRYFDAYTDRIQYDRMDSYDAREISRAEANMNPSPGRYCPRCGAKIEWGSGMVGESMAWCSRKGCRYGWEDTAGAIARVI